VWSSYEDPQCRVAGARQLARRRLEHALEHDSAVQLRGEGTADRERRRTQSSWDSGPFSGGGLHPFRPSIRLPTLASERAGLKAPENPGLARPLCDVRCRSLKHGQAHRSPEVHYRRVWGQVKTAHPAVCREKPGSAGLHSRFAVPGALLTASSRPRAADRSGPRWPKGDFRCQIHCGRRSRPRRWAAGSSTPRSQGRWSDPPAVPRPRAGDGIDVPLRQHRRDAEVYGVLTLRRAVARVRLARRGGREHAERVPGRDVERVHGSGRTAERPAGCRFRERSNIDAGIASEIFVLDSCP